MMWKVSALVAALGAASTIVGCVEEQFGPPAVVPGPYRAMASAELQTVGAPGPQDRPFGEALVAYALEVDRIHAFEGERADAAIGWCVLQLARILESLPAAAEQPALRRAAEAVRDHETGVDPAASEAETPPVERTKQSLAMVATALLDLARTSYRDVPQLAVEARALAGAVSGINSESALPDRSGILDALLRAERVLAGMYAVNVAPGPGPQRRPTPGELGRR